MNMEATRVKAYVGMRVRLTKKAPFFHGKEAVVAYVGTGGVSVYLVDDDFDECIGLYDGQFKPVASKKVTHLLFSRAEVL